MDSFALCDFSYCYGLYNAYVDERTESDDDYPYAFGDCDQSINFPTDTHENLAKIVCMLENEMKKRTQHQIYSYLQTSWLEMDDTFHEQNRTVAKRSRKRSKPKKSQRASTKKKPDNSWWLE
jgi:hypothetical protein